MDALSFWKKVAQDTSNLFETLFSFLQEQGVRFCVIGSHAVNAYVKESLFGLDLELAVNAESLENLEQQLSKHFQIQKFQHGMIISLAGSKLRVSIYTTEPYRSYVSKAIVTNVLGMELPVACPEDVLQGKILAISTFQCGSKRQKDLVDIARLLEEFPHLRDQVPENIMGLLG